MLVLILSAASASSPGGIPGWLALLFGGVGAYFVQVIGKRISTVRANYRKMKEAPSTHVAEETKSQLATMQVDIDELKKGYTKLNDWLGGTKDPWTGTDRHDGFIETFPLYQSEVRTALNKILERLPEENGNGKH